MKIEDGHGAEAYHVPPTGSEVQAALEALREAFGHEPRDPARGRFDPHHQRIQESARSGLTALGLGVAG